MRSRCAGGVSRRWHRWTSRAEARLSTLRRKISLLRFGLAAARGGGPLSPPPAAAASTCAGAAGGNRGDESCHANASRQMFSQWLRCLTNAAERPFSARTTISITFWNSNGASFRAVSTHGNLSSVVSCAYRVTSVQQAKRERWKASARRRPISRLCCSGLTSCRRTASSTL